MCWTNQTTLYLAIVKDTNAKKEVKKFKKSKIWKPNQKTHQIVPKSFKSFQHILGQYSVLFESFALPCIKINVITGLKWMPGKL